jgi:hypothetical protein
MDGVSSGISKRVRKFSVVGKGQTWGNRGSPKVSWERGSPSKMKKSGSCRRDSTYQSAVNGESPKPVKLDSESMQVRLNVEVGKDT